VLVGGSVAKVLVVARLDPGERRQSAEAMHEDCKLVSNTEIRMKRQRSLVLAGRFELLEEVETELLALATRTTSQ
jgi:hypothetical protein